MAFRLKNLGVAQGAKLLNSPAPGDHEYKQSDISGKNFTLDFYGEYVRGSITHPPRFRIKIKKGEMLSNLPDERWQHTPDPGSVSQPFNMTIRLEGKSGDIASAENISRYSDFKKWGLHTEYSYTAVPATEATGNKDIDLKIAVYDMNGRVSYREIGKLPIEIID